MLLGLAGGYAAGKNAVAALLEARGWETVDADELGREAMARGEVHDAIVARFGTGVVAPDGSLDRRALARIVFSDPRALADQEAIVHPAAIRLMEERIAAAESAARAAGTEPRICVNAALLHRAGIAGRLDAVIEVRAPLLARLARGARRDGAGRMAALRRVLRQRGFRRALRAALGGDGRGARPPIIVLRNGGSLADLERAVEAALAAAEARFRPTHM